MNTPKLFRYLLRDKVDLMILICTIMFFVLYLIKNPAGIKESFTQNTSPWLAVCALWMLGAICRMGSFRDLLDKYIKDPVLRSQLGLDSEIWSRYDRAINYIFYAFVVAMIAVIFINLLGQ